MLSVKYQINGIIGSGICLLKINKLSFGCITDSIPITGNKMCTSSITGNLQLEQNCQNLGTLEPRKLKLGEKPLKITAATLWISLERASVSWSGRARAGMERPRDGEAGHGQSSARDGVEEESDGVEEERHDSARVHRCRSRWRR